MLPGQTKPYSGPAVTCYTCEEKPATVKYCVESDSFGDEVDLLCAECIKERKGDGKTPGICDRCSADVEHVTPVRDMAEGSHGPVYQLCDLCHKKFMAEQAAEFDDDY